MQSCAVIGCGPAGMAASTVLRQSGLLVTCFDLAPEPGGIWASNARDIFSSRGCVSPIYPSMRCVLPKELMAFSDVRFDYAVAQFPHHTAVRHYLHQYAAQKGVRCLTRFNTKVESARFDSVDRMWKIISVNIVSGDVMEWSFDKVCVCTGQTQEVRFPAGMQEALEGYVREGGEVHHAAHVKDFRSFHKKRVVVVGNGVSAYDYCVELKRMGAEVYQSITAPAPSSASSGPQTGFACSSLTAELWKDMVVAPWGRGGATKEVSDVRVAADAVTRIAGLAARLPWLHNDAHAAKDVVRKWLRYRNTRLEVIPAVGLPLDNDGRGLRFAAAPSVRRSTADIVAEAKERVGHLDVSSAAPSAEVFVDKVDAVICATGYNRRYPFLHPNVRRVLEEDQLLLTSSNSSSPFSTSSDAAGGPPAASRHGLYLGTLWCAEPSLALVGYQKDLLPPFLLFEAQARFIAYAFTQRMPIPDGAEEMRAKEDALVKANPALADLYSGDGVGLHSAAYFNVLQHELGVSSRDTYTSKVLQRHKWLLCSTLVRIYHKCRSMAPLKRKEQHLLFSNKI
ncbi:Flavin-binding monooxygenase-like/Pyridine nucleotide-disulphide oxidoreductase/NAD(P)-binding Rossmann-like domain/L-lysine 6-monooxygenase (NADPH-requiring) [Leishmania donovani]|uniref:Flavin-binding monooxygenase-like family protein n=1 Tax=Leishmania donovani TaxID=5661 RepID=A0A6J8FB58_LEIDO|nr:Flavin-binding monooxygenase-like/Pyridine nucleotide-disulphide oxidoreductase/NAD(P)-binding Rossmann-like domain/L-lysine 6-monooxygenase (NADPH-requiring) [Leishmania donovani]VDZ43323.1 Flavin-binding_monooxygenase-like/Pyridine_nucleotide-disulphide_oxidoreductase/NAD(P)-binding_Rossmann-like_domain/L-lysine_6-monooxygenase_(NADPH-requiring)_putative/Pfam:PF00743/Pfam:PF07992/Pfam:PF13738/Pfam:PF13450/Pfam:PF13434 [Leishmania donovani]